MTDQTPLMTVPHHSEPAREAVAQWRYSINYGPDGEANYANVHAADGQFVGNLRTHHAIAICNAFAVCERLAASPAPAAGGLEAVAREYFAALESQPEKDCWDTETGKEEPGAEKFASDWAWQDHHAKIIAARNKLRAALHYDNAREEDRG